MSTERERRQDLLHSRPSRTLEDPRRDEEELLSWTSEQRLAAAIRQRRNDVAALQTYLRDQLPVGLRPTARLVLIRELGPTQARQHAERAFGSASLPFAATPDTAHLQGRPDVHVLYNTARAADLRDSVLRALRRPVVDQGLLLRLIQQAEGPVALSALALLRGERLFGHSAYGVLDAVTRGAVSRCQEQLLRAAPRRRPQATAAPAVVDLQETRGALPGRLALGGQSLLLRYGELLRSPAAIPVTTDKNGALQRLLGPAWLEGSAAPWVGKLALALSLDGEHKLRARGTGLPATLLRLPGLPPRSGALDIELAGGEARLTAHQVELSAPWQVAPALRLQGTAAAPLLHEAAERLLTDSFLRRPGTEAQQAALRLSLRAQASHHRLPALLTRLLDQMEGLARSLLGGAQALPAELLRRITAEVGPEAPRSARLHTGAEAATVAAAHRARAVALGEDVFFAPGAFRPGTAAGDFLIAHELAHVAQAQRGRNLRPAALAIDGGDVLDEGEAEANLKARLVVVKGQYPELKVPPAPVPTGLPDNEGERARQLKAQQERIATARGGAKGDSAKTGAARPGEAKLGAAPGAAPAPGKAAGTKAGRPVASPGAGGAAESAGAYHSAFTAPPSQHPEGWGKAGAAASQSLQAEETRFVATVPALPMQLQGKEAGKRGGAGGAGGPAPVGGKGQGANPPTTAPKLPETKVPSQAIPGQRLQHVGKDPVQLKQEGTKLLKGLKTSDPKLKTSAGPSPVVELSGASDPAQVAQAHHKALVQSQGELAKQRERIIAGPGPAQVQPLKLDEGLKLSSGDVKIGPMPELPKVDGMQKLLGWTSVTGDAKAAFDQIARPKIDQSIQPAKDKLLQAEQQRASDRSKAIADSQSKVSAANAEAQGRQAKEVQAARGKISAEQQATLSKQKEAVQSVETRGLAKRQEAMTKVDARVQADQAQIQKEYKGAETRAVDEQRRGEEEARRKREEAEREASEDQSWWDRAVSAVTDAIQAVASAIDQVLTAVRDAVSGILDAVRELAVRAIEATRQFIVEAIQALGEALQALVNETLGRIFPELAAALNRFIDAAVRVATAAVNAVADWLRQGVTALFNALKAAFNALIEAYRAAVRAAATFATALVTGDWSLVGRMLLEGILRVLGIDPGAFYALIGQAEQTINLILDNPGAFVGNLINAVKGGFQQFGRNFLTHLQSAFMQWLFGTMAEAGIQMPQRFDIAGVFDLVCQVLGLTYPRLRQKAVRLIGERNVQRFEFVWRYIESLLTGGWAGLWERIQQDLSNLQSMVVDGIKSWVMERVVQTAILRLATMWNPAGAILNLIMTAWNVYQWLRENAQRLFGLVQAVVQSMNEIATGNLSRAMNFIESTLARMLPIAISLLANLLGLGGIAGRIREIIDRIQGVVDQALDRLIERVMRMFRGGGDEKGKEKDDKGEDKDDKGDPEQRLKAGLAEAHQSLRQASEKRGISAEKERSIFSEVKQKHGLAVLEMREINGESIIHGEINPRGDKNSDLVKLKVNASRREARLILNPACRFPRDVAARIDEAQTVFNDMYREGGRYGDGSSAFMILLEQRRGGVNRPPAPIVGGTLHRDKCNKYIRRFNELKASGIPDEAENRIQVEIDKINEASAWADEYRRGDDPPLPRWARQWRDLF